MGLKQKGVSVSVRVPAEFIDEISADIERVSALQGGITESAYFAEAGLMRARGQLPPVGKEKAAASE